MFVSQKPTLNELTHKTAAQLYEEAKSKAETEKYNTAIKNLKAMIAFYPEHPKIQDAYVMLIHCYKAQGQFKDALNIVAILKKRYPDNKFSNLVLETYLLRSQIRMLRMQKKLIPLLRS